MVGGNWVFDNPNGQSACYESLEINTSCPRMAYSDFPMPEDYPAYAAHHQVADYFEAYVDHFGFRDTITFDTTRGRGHRTADGTWLVRTTGPDGERQREYDAVMVANGHHWDARLAGSGVPRRLRRASRSTPTTTAPPSSWPAVTSSWWDGQLRDWTSPSRRRRWPAPRRSRSRRGQWVMPKYLLGKAADQTAFPGWTPLWVTRARMALGARVTGNVDQAGHPAPRPPAGAEPPGAVGASSRSASGRPDHREAGDRPPRGTTRWCSPTAPRRRADLIVWATGYRVTFPFLDPELVAAQDNDLPLWKRMVHPDLPGLYFIGLVQAVGAVMPIAEAQSVWVAEMLTGQYVAAGRRRDPGQMARPRAATRSVLRLGPAHHGGRLRPLPVGPRPGARPRRRRRAAERDSERSHEHGRGAGHRCRPRARPGDRPAGSPAAGYVVHVTDVDEVLAAEAAREIGDETGGGVFASALDVRDPEACRKAALLTARVGPRPRPVGQQRRRAGHRSGVGASRRGAPADVRGQRARDHARHRRRARAACARPGAATSSTSPRSPGWRRCPARRCTPAPSTP